MRPNVLVIVADDLSQRDLRIYRDVIPSRPHIRTPNIEALAQSGLRFDHVHANPVCSPTRATLVTGQFGFRTGVVKGVKEGDAYELPYGIATLPLALRERGYRCGCFGKWHLNSESAEAPRIHGFDDYLAGSLFGTVDDYSKWERVDNGRFSEETEYATHAQAVATRDWIRAQPADQPWFAFLTFNAPHGPFHIPPLAYLPDGIPLDDDPEHFPPYPMRIRYEAMVMAMDQQIGELLKAVDLRTTTVFFLSDNGTPAEVSHEHQNLNKVKGSLFREGVEVPFVAAGHGVETSGGTTGALANTTDLFATVAELTGARLPEVVADSVSLLPYFRAHDRASIRSFAFSERLAPNGFGPYEKINRALREERFKYMTLLGEEHLYDLDADPLEEVNLLDGPLEGEAALALDRLRLELDDLLAS